MAILPVKKVLRPLFPRIIDCDLTHGTFSRDPKSILKWLKHRFFLKPTGLLRTQFFEKKSFLPVKKMFRPIFSRLSSVTNLDNFIVKVQKVF